MAAIESLEDIVEEGLRLVAAAGARDIPLRLAGGVAVRTHVQAGPLVIERAYKDIDLVTRSGQGRKLSRLMEELGYQPNRAFNATNGHRRLLFYDLPRERQVDVFVGSFEMCHTLPIADRLETDAAAIPLAELLLTKLQIVELNAKDQSDIVTMLFHHPVGESDDGAINAARVAELCAADWGLWRTVRMNVERTRAALPAAALDDDQRALVRERLDGLWARIDAEPKSRRWKLRDRIGDRVRWYEEPEEVG